MIDNAAHGQRLVERRMARTTMRLAVTGTVGSLVGAVIADRVSAEPWRSVVGLGMALALVVAMFSIVAWGRVRFPQANSASVTVLALSAAAAAAVAAVGPPEEWRLTTFVAALTLPNWLTALRAARRAHGS